MELEYAIIIRRGRYNHLFVCTGTHVPKNKDLEDSAEIKYVNSFKEAKELGWTFTDDIYFCPPDTNFVGLCPECSKKYKVKEVR